MPQAGSVNVIYGSPSGLTSSGDQVWSQGSGGLSDTTESGDDVGSGLVAENLIVFDTAAFERRSGKPVPWA